MIALAPGATIGRYVLDSRIAAGGMAEVWLAHAAGPRGFEKTVVIKSILPHRSRTQVGLLRAIKEPDTQPLPPSKLAPWIPKSFEALIQKAMDQDPERRFQHADEMRAALQQCLIDNGLFPTQRHVATHLEGLFPEGDTEAPSYHRHLAPRRAGRRESAAAPSPAAVAAFEAGLDLIRSRDYAGAHAALERALRLDPHNRVYRSNLKRLRERLENREGG